MYTREKAIESLSTRRTVLEHFGMPTADEPARAASVRLPGAAAEAAAAAAAAATVAASAPAGLLPGDMRDAEALLLCSPLPPDGFIRLADLLKLGLLESPVALCLRIACRRTHRNRSANIFEGMIVCVHVHVWVGGWGGGCR